MQSTTTPSFRSILDQVPCIRSDQDEIFITTTEIGQVEVLEQINQCQATEGKVMLFTSGMFGLNLAAARGDQISSLLCIDLSKKVEFFWGEVKQIIASSNREETIEKIRKFIFDRHEDLFPNSNVSPSEKKAESEIRCIDDEINKGVSWLSTEEKFERIKRIFTENNFAFFRVDFFEEESMKSIVAALEENKHFLDTIYVSNLREYAEFNQKLDYFKRTMEILKLVSVPQTILVDTALREGGCTNETDPLIQKLRTDFFATPTNDLFPASMPSLKSAIFFGAQSGKLNLDDLLAQMLCLFPSENEIPA